jgi:hypothetical protein
MDKINAWLILKTKEQPKKEDIESHMNIVLGLSYEGH